MVRLAKIGRRGRQLCTNGDRILWMAVNKPWKSVSGNQDVDECSGKGKLSTDFPQGR
jgi:hypothetical protein